MLLSSPPSFSGTLDELWNRFIEPNTPGEKAVDEFHRTLIHYVQEPDPLLLIRCLSGLVRRETYVTNEGERLKMTDNAPAWWVHYALFQDVRIAPGAFARIVDTIPSHLFDVARTIPASANSAGWHVAHIFPVKDGRSDYRKWRRSDAIGRFVRNIHPCNYFLLPKPEWPRWGADARVIAFFAERFADRYADVWEEFTELARVDAATVGRVHGPIRYCCEAGSVASASPRPATEPPTTERPFAVGSVRASYAAMRLLFKRDVIEPLGPHDSFRIVTPVGIFQMTKDEFHSTFPNVCASASYRDRGVYHYASAPRAALSFLVDEPAEGAGE